MNPTKNYALKIKEVTSLPKGGLAEKKGAPK
jgi:hypothetical protein